MKVTPVVRVLGLFALGLGALCPRAEAQLFNLDGIPSSSANPALVNTPFTLYVDVTNRTLISNTGVVVTNILSPSLQIISFSPNNGAISNGNVIVLQIGLVPPLGSQQATITVVPTALGTITNTFSVADTNSLFVRPAQDFVVPVTNNAPIFADLAIALTGPAQAVILNDYINYGIMVSNLGPNDAPGVIVTNSLVGQKFLTNSPGNLSRTLTSSNVIYNLGTLANGAVTNFSVRVQATSAAPLTLSTSVGAPGVTDTNAANNVASSNLVVGTYLSTNLVISLLNPTQQFNPQDSFMEQAIHLTNVGTNAVGSARVVITGLTKTNWLFNAAGTNNGNPFVVLATTLDTNKSVDLLLQFFVATGKTFPFTTNQLHGFEILPYDLTPPASIGTMITLSRQVQLNSGGLLLEFDAFTNRTYTIVYDDNMAFSNPKVAVPSVTSGKVNRLQWIDYGPPETISHPTNGGNRFYQVFIAP